VALDLERCVTCEEPVTQQRTVVRQRPTGTAVSDSIDAIGTAGQITRNVIEAK